MSNGSADAPRARPADVDAWAKDLTSQYTEIINNKRSDALVARTNQLSLNHSSSSSALKPPSSSSSRPSTSAGSEKSSSQSRSEKHVRKSKSKYSLGGSSKQPEVGPDGLPGYSRSAPKIPIAPADPNSKQFRALLHQLSNTPVRYENPGLLDEALLALPLDRIYSQAEEESQIMAAEAQSLGKKAKWGYQDCVIMALLKWFKNEFFQWVSTPKCTACQSDTKGVGMTSPTPEEQARGAAQVELYQCKNCDNQERFARYSEVWTLMQERRGRCGEWANCFSMLCRALGSKVRWVWNSEDHVWTEVYSEHNSRWVHVDACEEAWDKPRLYAEGWGKRIAYCIAFSHDSVVDVTRRYVRTRKYALPRTKCPEEVLLFIINEIRMKRRDRISPEDLKRLEKMERDEEKELRHFEVQSMVADGIIEPRSEGEKRPRQSGTTDWKRRRGEDGAQIQETRSPLHAPDHRMEQDGH